MTEAEAKQLIWNATITPDEWARRIRDGYRGKPYNYAATNYYRALKALRGSSGTSSPPVSGLAGLIQNVVYCAQNPLAALGAPAHWKPVLTADPGYASFTTPSVVAQLRGKFGKVGAWFVQTQVSVEHAKAFVSQYGLDFLIYQGETSEEYRTAVEADAHLIVGNANSWTNDQRYDATSRVAHGQLAFAQEAYTNLGNPWPDQTSSGGVPAASLVLGVYDGSAEVPNGWDPTLDDYRLHTPVAVWKSVSIYHASGVRDWGNL